MILAAIKGDFRLERVAQEVRNQWNDASRDVTNQVAAQHGWLTKKNHVVKRWMVLTGLIWLMQV